MPRRHSVNFKRDIGVDLLYGSPLIQKFINVIMERGKKSVASGIIYGMMDILVQKSNGNKEQALALFNKAFNQVMPAIEVRARRVGGSVYQVPREVAPDRSRRLAMCWIIEAAAKRSDKDMGQRLARELLEAVDGRGNAIKKKNDVHKMAEANRAFSHYAW